MRTSCAGRKGRNTALTSEGVLSSGTPISPPRSLLLGAGEWGFRPPNLPPLPCPQVAHPMEFISDRLDRCWSAVTHLKQVRASVRLHVRWLRARPWLRTQSRGRAYAQQQLSPLRACAHTNAQVCDSDELRAAVEAAQPKVVEARLRAAQSQVTPAPAPALPPHRRLSLMAPRTAVAPTALLPPRPHRRTPRAHHRSCTGRGRACPRTRPRTG